MLLQKIVTAFCIVLGASDEAQRSTLFQLLDPTQVPWCSIWTRISIRSFTHCSVLCLNDQNCKAFTHDITNKSCSALNTCSNTTTEEPIKQSAKVYARQVPGQWSNWTQFSECSITCDDTYIQGQKTRMRHCNRAYSFHGPCEGTNTENTPCFPMTICAAFDESVYIGGNGGSSYTDEQIWNNNKITGIQMECGDVVNSLAIKFNDDWSPKRGGDTVTYNCELRKTTDLLYLFESDEFLTAADITTESYINSIQFTTNKRVLMTCGNPVSNIFKLRGRRLLFNTGRGGCYIDGIKLVWAA